MLAYRTEQVRRLDAAGAASLGVPTFELMERAGRAAFDLARDRGRGGPAECVVLCGPGNNGGDGYVFARHALAQSWKLRVLALRPVEDLRGDARAAADAFVAAGGEVEAWAGELGAPSLLVDAVFGTGLEEAPRGAFAQAIAAVNTAPCTVLALDIPSGLCADRGVLVGEAAVRADATLSFVAFKPGHFLARGPEYCGALALDELGVPREVFAAEQPALQVLAEPELASHVAPRSRDSHKGSHGRVLVLGGEDGMGGAAILAGEAALFCGAGLVTLATRRACAGAALARRPELMAREVAGAADLRQLLDGFAGARVAIVVGPGLGTSAWGKDLLGAALDTEHPCVLDADGLNLVAQDGALLARVKARGATICTPHPGEAARLLRLTPSEVQADRLAAIEALSRELGGVQVLKGAGSLIRAHGGAGTSWICTAGNPGMAVGGMGDVLSGVIGSLLAQGHPAELAARLGVWLHATAGDDAAERDGPIGLLPSELPAFARRRLNVLAARVR